MVTIPLPLSWLLCNFWQGPFHAEYASTIVTNKEPAEVAFRAREAAKIIRVDSFHISGHVCAACWLARIEVLLTPHTEPPRAGFAPRIVVDELFPYPTFLAQFFL